jgi:hypothetical protein
MEIWSACLLVWFAFSTYIHKYIHTYIHTNIVTKHILLVNHTYIHTYIHTGVRRFPVKIMFLEDIENEVDLPPSGMGCIHCRYIHTYIHTHITLPYLSIFEHRALVATDKSLQGLLQRRRTSRNGKGAIWWGLTSFNYVCM